MLSPELALVQVIAGKDKGLIGNIIAVLPKKGRVVVENVNKLTKNIKAKAEGEQGKQEVSFFLCMLVPRYTHQHQHLKHHIKSLYVVTRLALVEVKALFRSLHVFIIQPQTRSNTMQQLWTDSYPHPY